MLAGAILYCFAFAGRKTLTVDFVLLDFSDVPWKKTPYRNWLIDWLIDWGLTPFLTISQLYQGGQFAYSCISWFSHTGTPHNNLPKQLAAFPHRLRPLVEYEWRMSHWLLSIIGKKIGRAGIRTHNPWIDIPRRYRLSYRGSALNVIITRAE